MLYNHALFKVMQYLQVFSHVRVSRNKIRTVHNKYHKVEPDKKVAPAKKSRASKKSRSNEKMSRKQKKSRQQKKVAPAKKKVAPEKKSRAKGKKVFTRMKERIHLQYETVRTRV